MDPALLKAIREYPMPRNVSAVREFLGMTGHYREFIDNFAEIAEPLSSLTGKKDRFEWGPNQTKAFLTLKSVMESSKVLMAVDYTKDVHMHTDASLIASSCIVSQKDEKERLRPVFCASWVFNAAQRRYNAADRELLALVWSTKKVQISITR